MDEECKLYGYGFAYSRRGIIGKFSAEIDNLLDLEHAEGSLIDKRFVDCLRHDQLKFNGEHYMYVLFKSRAEIAFLKLMYSFFVFPENIS